MELEGAVIFTMLYLEHHYRLLCNANYGKREMHMYVNEYIVDQL